MRILVVEDNTMIANVLAAVLRPMAKYIELAHSLKEAREKVATGRFNCITLDLDLPDSLPEHTLIAIADLKRLCPCEKVIVVSGTISPAELAQARKYGADGFLHKTDPDFPDKIKLIAAALRPSILSSYSS